LFPIQREDGDAVADGEDQQRGRAIDGVAGRNLGRARLQEGGFSGGRGGQVGAFRAFQD